VLQRRWRETWDAPRQCKVTIEGGGVTNRNSHGDDSTTT
jgi:hypothetical protein